MYKYEFEKEKCWYKESCGLFETEKCNSSCNRYMEMHYLINNSNLPKSKQKPDVLYPDTIDLELFIALANLKDNILHFVEEGNNLYLYSRSFGNGKTSWAIKLMLKYLDEVWCGNGFRTRAIFINVPTFLTKLKENISTKDPEFNRVRNLLDKADLVIWDDIAASKLSDYDYTNLLTYIDSRCLNNKSNIYTGNLDGEEIVNALGNRLASRVYNGSLIAEFKGTDKRGDGNGSITNFK